MPATVEDLGKKVKAKYPGEYDDLPDALLGQKIKAKYPEDYSDFTDIPDKPKGTVDKVKDYLSETAGNIPSSAMNVVSGIGGAFKKGLTDPSTYMGPMKVPYDLYRNAIGEDTTIKDTFNHYKDRLSHPIQTLHDDPVGSALDLAGLWEGGAGALRGIGGALEGAGAAEAGGALRSMGESTSPASRLGTPAKGILKGAGNAALDAGTQFLEKGISTKNPGKAIPASLRMIRDIYKGGLQGYQEAQGTYVPPEIPLERGNFPPPKLSHATSEFNPRPEAKGKVTPITPVPKPKMSTGESRFRPDEAPKKVFPIPGKRITTNPIYSVDLEELPSFDESGQPHLSEKTIHDIQERIMPQPTGPAQLRSKSSARLAKDAEALKEAKNRSVKPAINKVEDLKNDPRMKELSESLNSPDPYELKIEESEE